MKKIPSRRPPVQDVAERPSLAEDVNANRYCDSIQKFLVLKTERMGAF
jgi:hypothetical protein